ncbi:AEC family transporter [Heyndrickxia coagulans]|uniref:Membrane transport family protein n=1 Tax=Heyndrickxia coagulans DSM 1 = ATCC 7050 TaxID=1121088 RepID=A0A8B4BV42_HEYCO|nr:AEC family transporter [Heyndrickxia coagulans]AJH78206.1 membrane transport family protein [Heyndrickxia coagulans DSM 1 = ATCC 7050]MCR2846722.1 AEC family transporter [Heyndrickxia coagulans]MDR4223912.1 AEC family transporter [Heyndrickxia coagulans DSM 1 = ATCC 7050]MED4492733.1 AEC family transporter [Heyndrickxia coagulans]MED4536194.1 AEC family transporter [Heyndrickxia coagulans]
MGVVLTKAASFILIIVLGYILKRIGFFKPDDFQLVSRMVLNITLPCAVITNFEKLSLETSLLMLVAIGVFCNLVMIATGYIVSWRRTHTEKAFNMINYSGYNIGCFTLPYVQNFLGPVGVVATCLFDAGNSVLCTGGTYSIASAVANNERTNAASYLKKMFSSIPMDTYLIMLVLSLLHITLPTGVTAFTGIVGQANGFLAMLMIGIGFELRLEKSQVSGILKAVIIRYGMAILFAAFFYFLLPLPLEVRLVLVIIAFAPISAVCTAFTQKCGGNVAMSSTLNSLSILISIVLMTSLMVVLKIA